MGKQGEEGGEGLGRRWPLGGSPAAGTPVRNTQNEWSDEDEVYDEDAADEEFDERFLYDGDSQPTTPAPTDRNGQRTITVP